MTLINDLLLKHIYHVTSEDSTEMLFIHFQCMEKNRLDILPNIYFCVPHENEWREDE